MVGRHVILDLYNVVDSSLLNDNQKLYNIFREAVDLSGAHYIGHKFSPQGVSGAIIISESHLTWHSWPEHRFLAIDYFTCEDGVIIDKAINYIIERLSPEQVDYKQYYRGGLL